MTIPVALTIAGSDSGGGAGIQADLKTFQAFGVFGTSAVTAITAQNTLGVSAVHAVPGATVHDQISAVARDFRVAAVKTGMLATRELVLLVADSLREHELPNYVLDPVMVATSGARLLDEDAVAAVLDHLVPSSTIVTPNLDEAEILTGTAVHDVATMIVAAERLVAHGARAALIKGGHLAGTRLTDVLLIGERLTTFEAERVESSSTHGTGCTLSAAIAAGLARGADLQNAVADALDFVRRAIATAPAIGHGHGPLNHFIAARATAAD